MGTPVCSVCRTPARGLVGKPVDGTDHRHRKCGEGALVMLVDLQKGPQKAALAADARKKAADRKALTGRDHQGNHDSRTKPEVRGGPKGDRHANGVRQAGKAGQTF